MDELDFPNTSPISLPIHCCDLIVPRVIICFFVFANNIFKGKDYKQGEYGINRRMSQLVVLRYGESAFGYKSLALFGDISNDMEGRFTSYLKKRLGKL